MPFNRERFDGLRDLRGEKNLSDFALAVSARPSTVSDWRTGTSQPGTEMLERIADHLECTTDFLLGRSHHDTSLRAAASAMALDVFCAQLDVSPEWKRRCHRIVQHEAAPVTAQGWRTLAEQIDLAVGSGPPQGRLKAVP